LCPKESGSAEACVENWKTTAVGSGIGLPVAVMALIQAVAEGTIQVSWPLVGLAAIGLGFAWLGYVAKDAR
jgi:hypothetical protein